MQPLAAIRHVIDQSSKLRRLELWQLCPSRFCLHPWRSFPGRDILHCPPGRNAGQAALDQLVARSGKTVVDLAQQPVLALLLGLPLDPHQQPLPLHSLTIKREVQMSLLQIFRAFARYRCPGSAIPQHYRAAAILSFGNGALETAIIQWMVLSANRQPFIVGVQARPARDRPALQDAVDFQPEIPMQPRGIMLLHNKGIAFAS
jgi:hypothetical protein